VTVQTFDSPLRSALRLFAIRPLDVRVPPICGARQSDES